MVLTCASCAPSSFLPTKPPAACISFRRSPTLRGALRFGSRCIEHRIDDLQIQPLLVLAIKPLALPPCRSMPHPPLLPHLSSPCLAAGPDLGGWILNLRRRAILTTIARLLLWLAAAGHAYNEAQLRIGAGLFGARTRRSGDQCTAGSSSRRSTRAGRHAASPSSLSRRPRVLSAFSPPCKLSLCSR